MTQTNTMSNKRNGAIGDCVTDTFSLNNPGGVGSPVICGYNTGQHSEHQEHVEGKGYITVKVYVVIVDASDRCNVASFHLGKGEAIKRNWDITGGKILSCKLITQHGSLLKYLLFCSYPVHSRAG